MAEKTVKVKITKSVLVDGAAYRPDGNGGLVSDEGKLKTDVIEMTERNAKLVIGAGRGQYLSAQPAGALTKENTAGLVKTQRA